MPPKSDAVHVTLATRVYIWHRRSDGKHKNGRGEGLKDLWVLPGLLVGLRRGRKCHRLRPGALQSRIRLHGAREAGMFFFLASVSDGLDFSRPPSRQG